MIYALNTNGVLNGQTINPGSPINGTTPSGYPYTVTYYNTGDTFGGTAYIKGVGTAGSFKRTIYASIIGGNSEAFKYCLFTQTGGYTKTNYGSYPTITMSNSSYSGYTYNQNGATVPNPDWTWYTNSANYPSGVFTQLELSDLSITIYNSSFVYYISPSNYNGVIYVHYTENWWSDTLNINFDGGNYDISIITDFPNVNIVLNWDNKDTIWKPAKIVYENSTDKWKNQAPSPKEMECPAFLHKSSTPDQSNVAFDLTNAKSNQTFTVQGFLYSNSPVTFSYGSAWGHLNINGTLFAKSLTTDWDYNETTFNYTKDYYNNPPPHFGSASGFTYLPGSYREEY
jgi:hypothetical protein